MGTLALIGLGSNLGDRKAHLDWAVASLSAIEGATLRARSTYQETAPVGGPGGQGTFLNGAAALETSLEPETLLGWLHAIEQDEGRVREERWGARTLDLDLLLFGDRVVDTPRLQVPHPRMALRRFVLAPLAEIAADAVDPMTRRTVADLLANLDRRPSYLAFARSPDWNSLWFLETGCQTSVRYCNRPADVYPTGIATNYRNVARQLRATEIENRFSLLGGPKESPFGPEPMSLSRIRQTFRMMSVDREDEAHLWLSARFWPARDWGQAWVTSHFWFDAFYLSMDSLKSGRPRNLAFKEQFLEAREEVIQPTFVVASPKDAQRLGLRDKSLEWQRPIGWDTPLLVTDLESPGTVDEIVATCAGTRSA
jgi:2-amino-4-hydroxy-6-hydroxymethyldihydropteridine diphosphokinase